jgi:quinol-cytochrome oxidoreductase complex cytochrome b subunit
MSSDPTQTTSQIQDELLTEVKQELERRGTTLIPKTRTVEKDTLAAFAVSAILACMAILAGTGAVMALGYTPTVEDANASTAWFSAGALGGVARAAHYHASNLLVLLSGAYLGYLAWRGLFRRPAQWRWWRAMILLGLAVMFSLSGQLLPFDQLALHGTGIRLGYLAEAPVIGSALREIVQGGETIGNSTLTRFFGMHVVVLPALCVILLRWLWRDSDSGAPPVYNLAVAGAVLVLVVAAAMLFAAPLGLQGNLSEPYPEARPEWFGLPLYALMRVAPPGVAHLLILFAAPLLMLVVMLALPFIETAAARPARLRKPLQIGLIAAVAFLLIFSAVPVIQDMSADEGWFRKQSPEDVMTAMGTRNKSLMNSTELPPADAHNHARDMLLLHERLIGNYPDPIDAAGRTKWDELANKGVEAARRLLLAPDSATQIKAREELRQVCKDCHKEHEKEDVQIDPPPLFAAAASREPERVEFFFNQDALATLQPTTFERTTSTTKMMDQLKYSLRDILIEAEVIEDRRSPDKPKRSREQALVDLRAVTEIVATHYEKNAGSFFEEPKWNTWVADLRKATAELAIAKDATDVGKKTAAVGKACESCHDGADDLTEPIEWRFQSLLTPD